MFSNRTSSNRRLPTPAPILHRLSPSTKILDLSQNNSWDQYSVSQVKRIAKRFHKIIRFSLLGGKTSTNRSLLLAITMIKKANILRHLSLKDVFDKASSEKLLRLISRCKLKTLDLTSIPSSPFSKNDEPSSWLNYYPSTVENLSLSWKDQPMRVEPTSSIKNLQKLVLGMPLSIESFKDITKSIQNPSKLKTLQFHLEESSKKDSSSSEVQAFLESCSNLEQLDLTVYTDIAPKNLKLRRLSLTCNFSEGTALGVLGFIQQQKEYLESLDLTLGISEHILIDEVLEGLKSLRKLKLKVKSKLSCEKIAKLIENLECLEEIDFMGLLIKFDETDFEQFCKALEKKFKYLRSLKLSFNGWKLNKKNSNVFFQTLALLTRLEHITLTSFGMENEYFFSGLRDIVCSKNKGLNEVFLENVERQRTTACCENLIQMLRDMLRKPTMKKLRYLESGGSGSDYKDLEILSLSNDVLKEVHHFEQLHLLSYICEPTFFFWDLSWHKWNQQS